MLTAVPLAHAQNASATDGSSSKKHTGQYIQEIYKQLDLTDDQKKQLEVNKQQLRAKMQSFRQQMKVDRDALRLELMKPQLAMAQIKQIHDQIKSLQDQMEDEKLNSILAVRAILTPAQYLKFIGLMHKNKERDQAGEHQERE